MHHLERVAADDRRRMAELREQVRAHVGCRRCDEARGHHVGAVERRARWRLAEPQSMRARQSFCLRVDRSVEVERMPSGSNTWVRT
jgi:hypothetical protein